MRNGRQQDETGQLAVHAETFCRRVREGLVAADFERKRALLELLVDRVIVTDGVVEIRYVVPTGPEGDHAPFSRLRTDHRGGRLALEARRGDALRSRTDGRRATEVAIAAGVLNRMLALGRPEYVRVA